MLHLDHAAIAVDNLFSGYMDFRRQTGLEVMVGGYFNSGNGVANVLIPTNNFTFLEIESVIQFNAPHPSPMFSNVGSPKWVGWCIRVDSLEELEEVGDRIGAPVSSATSDYVRYNGELHPPQPSTRIDNAWELGHPSYYLMDLEHHVGNVPLNHATAPAGFRWFEIGGTEKQAHEMLGVHPDELNIRCNGRDWRGLWAVSVAVDEGDDIVIRYA
jgi:hypothetical protein